MRSLVFEGNTWEQYEKLREQDKRLHKALCKLLKEMLRSNDLTKGFGKPEPLKHNLSGLWSRRISLNLDSRSLKTFIYLYLLVFFVGIDLLNCKICRL